LFSSVPLNPFTVPQLARSVIDWGSAARALAEAGDLESGDHCVVAGLSNGALVAVIDGLGHGSEAAYAARTAGQVLTAHAAEPVLDLVQRCHAKLHKTRGVVMTLASFNVRDSTITWAAVGNVEAVLLRMDQTAEQRRQGVIARGGVVGYRLPPLHAATLPIAQGDTLIMATDGISGGFWEDLVLYKSPQEIADTILARYGKGTDDALVLVARYIGGAA
jgi:negative regulator of sigma-B (phosphoserine phosphatase)